MLGHETNLSKFKIEIIASIFSDSIKLEINNKKKTGKFINTWKLNNTLMNDHWIKEKTKREIKYLETNEKRSTFQNLGNATKAVL